MKSLILYIKIKYVIMHVVLYMNINVLTLVKITTRHGENHAIHASASWSLLVVCLVDQDVTGDQGPACPNNGSSMFHVKSGRNCAEKFPTSCQWVSRQSGNSASLVLVFHSKFRGEII